jgi:cytochrome P450
LEEKTVPELHDLDLFSPTAKANPYPAFSLVRTHDPIHQLTTENEQNAWFITRYEDALAILKDQRFIKDARKLMTSEQLEQAQGSLHHMASMHMLSYDPPDHTRLRSLVNLSFTPRFVEQWRERIQTITDELIDAIQEQNATEIDLIDTFAFPLPIMVITEMLGVPSEDSLKFRAWSNALLDVGNDPAQFERVQGQVIEFAMYLQNLISIKSQQATDDLVGRLLHTEADGDKLNEIELMGMIFLLLVAGHETTVNLIANGMLALLQHPDQKHMLQEDPALIKTAIEEFLRFHSPVAMATNRWVGEDLEFGGKQMQRGDSVILSLAAANHDPAEFAHPDELDLTRKENRHVAFGMGIHYCLGAPLARLEGQIAIGTLLRRLPNLRLAVEPEQLIWRPSMLLFGLSKLPVTF